MRNLDFLICSGRSSYHTDDDVNKENEHFSAVPCRCEMHILVEMRRATLTKTLLNNG
jgi:hypothetical protein